MFVEVGMALAVSRSRLIALAHEEEVKVAEMGPSGTFRTFASPNIVPGACLKGSPREQR